MADKAKMLLLLLSLSCGCTRLQDTVIRSWHMDFGYRGKILPLLIDRYQQNMEYERPAGPEFQGITPPFLDQG